MERIGKINGREIFYISIRNNSDWKSLFPNEKWGAFTIADKEDKEMLHESTIEMLSKNVTYTCSAGELGSLTENYFDEEISWRRVQYEEKTGEKFDYDKSPMTTMHRNFGEGFWFATTLAYNEEKEIDQVICVDFTKRKVRKHLMKLIKKINNDWLPSDKEIELAEYDN